jgi:SSS family solute:Na+ symporter
MATAMFMTLALHWDRLWLWLVGRPEPFSGSSTVIFAKTTLTTTLVTTLVWIAVTLCTSPEPEAILLAFYRKVRPQVTGWRVIAGLAPEVRPTRDLGRNLWCWILGCVMTYSALFGVGKLLLRKSGLGTMLVLLALVCAWLMWRELDRVADNETN